MAVSAWNIMEGLNWEALPSVAEMLGVDNVELLISQLVAIRSHVNKPKE